MIGNESYFYRGTVVHARKDPVAHGFSYPIAWYAFNVDKLSELDRTISWFGYNRFSFASLSDVDYLKKTAGTIRSKVESLLAEYNVLTQPAKIYLVTTPKLLGWAFNPVSFYYLYDQNNRPFCYLAEINNTYEERTVYVFPRDKGVEKSGGMHFSIPKHFHVSPFYDEKGEYKVFFGDLGEKFEIKFNLHRLNEKPFTARMYGTGKPLSHISHPAALLRSGLSMALTLPRIYVQAMRLLFQKKLTVFKKPDPLIPMETHKTVTLRAEPRTWFDKVCRSLVRPVLQQLRVGQLRFTYPDGSNEYYGDAHSSHIGEIHLRNYKFFWKLIHSGGIGFGESYVDGDWETPDLAQCMKVILDNDRYMHESKFNLLRPVRWLHRFSHWLKKNSKLNSQKNISDHYDLGNKMFSFFLDDTMAYSSGVYPSADASLHEAQVNKLHTILKKSQLQPGERLLEIGCGWGELSAMAAKEYGASVTGITLSVEQKKIAENRMVEQGVSDQVQIQLRDYRDVHGEFDKIVSVEMIEAVGKEYLGSFFKTIDGVLSPNGTCVLQVIAYSDPHYKEYLGRQDWIQKHIFPGSHLPSLTALCEAMSANSNLVIDSVENYAQDYARTLREWRTRFNQKAVELAAVGYDSRFQRAWNFYLASCEAEFDTRWLSLYQIVLTRPNNGDFIARHSDGAGIGERVEEKSATYIH